MSTKAKTADLAGAAPKKTKKPSMKWTKGEERRFIREFTKVKMTKKEQATGGGIGMSSQGWDIIFAAMNKPGAAPNGIIYTKEHLQNKIPTLAKDYKSYEFLMRKQDSGVIQTERSREAQKS